MVLKQGGLTRKEDVLTDAADTPQNEKEVASSKWYAVRTPNGYLCNYVEVHKRLGETEQEALESVMRWGKHNMIPVLGADTAAELVYTPEMPTIKWLKEDLKRQMDWARFHSEEALKFLELIELMEKESLI